MTQDGIVLLAILWVALVTLILVVWNLLKSWNQ